jgi:uncharacterized membrane protein
MLELMTILYRIILAVIIVLIFTELFTQKKISAQATAAMALIPFVLRALMIV